MTGKIKLVHSGGNSVSVAVPTNAPSASEVEFKLPQSDGSSGQRIVTDGSGNLSFASAGASGKILQVVQTVKTDHFSVSNANGSDITGMSVAITPSSSSNKVLISIELAWGDAGNGYAGFRLIRVQSSGDTNIGQSTALDSANSANTQDTAFACGSESSQGTYKLNNTSFEFLDSPSTTSATTYKLQIITWTSGTFHLNRPNSIGNARYTMSGTSTMTAKEVAA